MKLLILMLRKVGPAEEWCKSVADTQVWPHHCAHHPDDHNSSKHAHHIHSLLPGQGLTIDPLVVLMPELYEEGEKMDRSILGCLGCDILRQVSQMSATSSADHQLFHALAWMWLGMDPRPKMDKLNRAGLDIIVARLIQQGISLGNMYRLAAARDHTGQQQTIINNEEWAWSLLPVRMSEQEDLW